MAGDGEDKVEGLRRLGLQELGPLAVVVGKRGPLSERAADAAQRCLVQLLTLLISHVSPSSSRNV